MNVTKRCWSEKQRKEMVTNNIYEDRLYLPSGRYDNSET